MITLSEAPAREQSSSDVVVDHERDVWSVAVTSDNKHVVAGYLDGRVRLTEEYVYWTFTQGSRLAIHLRATRRK